MPYWTHWVSLCISPLPPIVSTMFPSCLRVHCMLGRMPRWGWVHADSLLETDYFIISLRLRAVSMATTGSSTNLAHTKDTPLWRRKTGSATHVQERNWYRRIKTLLLQFRLIKPHWAFLTAIEAPTLICLLLHNNGECWDCTTSSDHLVMSLKKDNTL